MGTGLKLERDKVYRARNGSLWRVVCVDAPGDEPVVAVPAAPGQGMWAACFTREGRCTYSDERSLIAEHREPREWAAFVDPAGALHAGFHAINGCEQIRVREVLD